MDALSKVTRYVRDVYVGLQQGGETTETQTQCCAVKKEVEFEHLGDACTPSANGHSTVPDKVVNMPLIEFEVCTVSYGPSFFPFAYSLSAKHKSTGKNEDP